MKPTGATKDDEVDPVDRLLDTFRYSHDTDKIVAARLQLKGLINERERLREALRDVGIRLHGIQLHASSGAENAYDIASDLRGIRDQILRTLNDTTPSTSAVGG